VTTRKQNPPPAYIPRRERKLAQATALTGIAFSSLLAGAILAACGGGAPGAASTPQAAAPAGIPVSVTKVTRDTVAQVASYGGSINPKDQVSVLPRVAGRVVRTFVETGDAVTAGQAIAELDHATLDAQVAQANANVSGAIANLAAARARYEGVMAGAKADDVAAAVAAVDAARVRLDQALAGTRPEDLRSAEVAVQAARTRLDLGRAGGRPEDVQAAQAQLDAARNRLAQVESGARPEDVTAAQAQLDAARNRLAQVEAGARAEDLKSAESDLATARIRLTQLQNPRAEDVQSAQAVLDQARTRLSQARDAGLGSGITARPRPEDLSTLALRVSAAQATLEKAWADQAKGPTSTSTAQALELAVRTAQISVLVAQNDLSKANASGGPTEWDLRLLEEAEQLAKAALEKVAKPSPADLAAAHVAVEKAQALFDKARTVLPYDVEAARQSLVQAQATYEKTRTVLPYDVETARQSVVQAQATLDKARVTDPSTIAQLEQAHEAAVASLEKLRNPLPFDVDLARANLAQAEAQLSARRNPYTDQDRAASEAAVRQAEAALAQQQAALAILQVSLNEALVVAPFAGIVAERLVTAGAVVQVTTPVATLMSRETEISLSVEESAIARFREGSAATFTVNAYPGSPFKGAVTSVFPTGDARSRTFTVKVRPEDADGKLKPGMYAQLVVTLDQRANVPVVPRDAVVLRGDKPFVFAVVDNVAQLRALELGLSDDKRSEVKSGVQADDTIVVNGQASLRDKDTVRVIQPGQAGAAGGQGAAGAGASRPAAGGSGGAGAGGSGGAGAGGSGGAGAGGQGAAGAGGQGAAGAGGQGAAGAGWQGAAGAGGSRAGGGQGPGGATQGGSRSGGDAQPTPTRAP
jgi:membrane fusion protein (multidrug efflux system)